MSLETAAINITEIDEGHLSPAPGVMLRPNVMSVLIAEINSFIQHISTFEHYLSENELLRANGYHRQTDRDCFVLRRGLLRSLLAQYLNQKPERIQLERDANGKPYCPNASGRINFSMSQSYGTAVYVFSNEYSVGIDLEKVDSAIDCEPLAEHYFTPQEAALIRRTHGKAKTEAFFKCWTYKEAYIKLLGPCPLNTIETQQLTSDKMTLPHCRYAELDIRKGYQCVVGYRPA